MTTGLTNYGNNSVSAVPLWEGAPSGYRRYEGEATKYSVLDVVNCFLSHDAMTHKKLQKLCYYAQALYYALQS